MSHPHRKLHRLSVFTFFLFSALALLATRLVAVYFPRTDAESTVLTLPDLVGTPYVEGDERLPAGLVEIVFDYRTDADTTPGTVLRQDPAPHSERRVVAGRSPCVLHLTLSTGKATYTVPNLIGKSARETEAILRSAGLTVRTKTARREDLSPGQVIAVEPPEGTTLCEGQVITLTESTVTTRRVVTVPQVIGADAASANSTLVLRGLRPDGKITYEPSDAPRGTVISQRPLAGTLVPIGSAASLILSDGSAVLPPTAAEQELEYEG